jgi:hypothetical protein
MRRRRKEKGEAPRVYDPETCITAKELRKRAIPVPKDVPDEAWIGNDQVTYDMDFRRTPAGLKCFVVFTPDADFRLPEVLRDAEPVDGSAAEEVVPTGGGETPEE